MPQKLLSRVSYYRLLSLIKEVFTLKFNKSLSESDEFVSIILLSSSCSCKKENLEESVSHPDDTSQCPRKSSKKFTYVNFTSNGWTVYKVLRKINKYGAPFTSCSKPVGIIFCLQYNSTSSVVNSAVL